MRRGINRYIYLYLKPFKENINKHLCLYLQILFKIVTTMKISFQQIFPLFAAFLFSSETSANFFFGNVVGNNGVNSINKNVRFRYPPRTQNFMAKQNFQLGQILSKTTTKTPNKSSKNSSKNQRKNKKPKILMKSKGLLLNNNQHFKTTFKNVFGFKTVFLRKKFFLVYRSLKK
ncbi:unnamed protein product [Meloidogyne enterolobii]|uniref:Uncharacterized protein n=1 Tax=Meloidogyne enterolobii TaxID=390850 RepID=A0ACB0XYR6_MELEN